MASIHEGDLTVRGTLRATTMVPSSQSVGDAECDAGDPITAEKLEHQYIARLAQVHGSAATAERRVVHCAYGAGDVVDVRAGVVVAAIGDSTVTVDVKKNGTTILSAPIVLDATNLAYAEETGSVSVAAFSAGDVLEVFTTVAAGTGTLPQGLYVNVVLHEAAD